MEWQDAVCFGRQRCGSYGMLRQSLLSHDGSRSCEFRFGLFGYGRYGWDAALRLGKPRRRAVGSGSLGIPWCATLLSDVVGQAGCVKVSSVWLVLGMALWGRPGAIGRAELGCTELSLCGLGLGLAGTVRPG